MALTLVPGIGPVASKHLLGYCGSAEAVFKEKKRTLSLIPGVGKVAADAIFAFNGFYKIDAELKFAEENNIRIVSFTSPDYPLRLKQELDGPLVLYIKGTADLNAQRMIAVVGTRRNTLQGAEITKNIIEELASLKISVVSGLAYGIDIIAHKACLNLNIPTIGVVAHGLDTLYPGHHASYAKKMSKAGGAVISEHMSGTVLNPDLFPRRNRIVAALVDAVVVVESQIKGGSMITADIASSYNRDVFAIPGRPGDPMSEGCNFLIKNLKATLCENGCDIAKAMNWDIQDSKKPVARQNQLFENLTAEEKTVTSIINGGELVYDDLLIKSQIPVHKLSYMLLDMEMRGLIRSLPGKKYSVCR